MRSIAVPARGVLAAMLVLGLVSTPKLSANSITYNFDRTLIGVSPSGTPPWLTATFTDNGANSVRLTLSAVGLTGDEYVGKWYFNLNPAMNASSLTFSETGSSGSFTSPTVQTGTDAFKPDWDGKYDVLVDFSTLSGVSTTFGGGDSVTFTITGISGLTASDFLYANTASAGHSPLFAAADIQTVGEAVIIDTPPDSVPDGVQTLLLLGMALSGIVFSKCWFSIRQI